jgi:hypothetical protein
MARGGSSKKVARAARAGGRVRGVRERSFLFPALITVICVLGVALIVYARTDRRQQSAVPPVANKDHWHAAYGIFLCNHFEPAILTFESPEGIHTHGDGVIHIHPFSEAASGRNATLGKFLEQTSVKLSDTSLEVGSKKYKNGDKCDNKKGHVVVAKWKNALDDKEEPTLITKDLAKIRFQKDGEAYTIAFVADGTKPADIQRPETAKNLPELGAVDSGQTAPSTSSTENTGASSTSTTAVIDTSTTATTAPGATTSSTAAATTTTR